MQPRHRAMLRGGGLYAIADVDSMKARSISVEDSVLALLRSGAPVLQLRWKSGAAGPLLETARFVATLCRAHGALFVVNDRVDIAMAAGADGVHLGQDDVPIEHARALLPPGAIVGLSTHEPAQVEEAIVRGADYIGFGPVFATRTKANPDAVVGVRGLSRAVSLVSGRLPVVAIGGIDLGRIDEIARTGVDLAAVISDIIEHPEPASRARVVHEAMLRSRVE